MKSKRKRKDGVAMIMVLVMIIIFASLILAVVISSTTAIRRAHFYKDKNTALQIAIAGVQEVLYRMNYSQYNTGQYPAFNTPSEDIILTGFPSGAKATLSLDSSCETKIVSQGSYRGRTAQVSVYLKGYAKLGDNLNAETSGIPEAFNKHTIYANTVSFPASPTGIQVKGNITAETINNKPASLSQATFVETTINLSDLVHFETHIYSFSLPAAPFFDNIYSDTGYVYNASYPGGVDVNTINDGVYWNGGTYYFGRNNDNTSPETFFYSSSTTQVNANVIVPSNAGSVTITRYFKSTGSITINKNITTTTSSNDFAFETTSISIANGVEIDGNLVVKGAPLTLNNTIKGNVMCDKDITVNGGSINGSVLSNKSIAVSGRTINGSVLCYNIGSDTHTIGISGGTIDARNSNYDAAVYIHNSASGSGGTINISGFTTITLGENQRAGIAVVAPTGTINVNSPFTINYPSDPPDQFAVVNYCGNSNTNITANNLNLRGSIYSYDTITLNDSTQTITGILVAGNVGIGNNSKIIYDPEPYKQNSQVYKGFSWGRRRYVPVPGSWQIRW